MNRRVLKIVGWLVALALVLGVGAVAGGGIVYAMTRANESIRLVSAEQLDPNPEPGIVIASVAPDGPAAEAGVVRGDILLQVDDEAVDNLAELMRALRAYEPGDEVALTVLHGDDERTLTATLGDRDGQPYLGLVPCAGLPRSGHRVTVHTAGPGATIIGVEPDSPADLAGLQAGDVIVAVDGQELGSENNLADVIATYEPGDTVTLKVKQPGEDTRDVTVELGEHPEPEKEGMAYLGVRYRPFLPFHVLEGEALPFDWRPGRPFLPGEFSFHIVPGGELDGEIKQGAIVRRVEEDSPAAAAGLHRGDVITAIEGEPIESPQDLTDAVAEHKPGDKVTLTVFQPGEEEEREIEVTLAEHPEDTGNAYLGVQVGGFFRLRRFKGDGERPHRMDLFLDLKAPFDELPFEPDAVPHHFKFHFPPKPFGGDGADCPGESV